ncbi:EF-hand domain-containing family member B [Schistosoma japonicum]|nr:EF-hand domain-containing family member B [Schistosoma japonicum]
MLRSCRSEVKDLIRPPDITVLSETIKKNREKIYESTKRRPLGCSPMQHLPPHLDKYNTTFGMIYEKGDTAGELINPPKKQIDVTSEEIEDHQYYLISHKHFHAGEQAHRNYKNFDDKQVFGIKTNCDPRGKHVRQAMNWTLNNLNNHYTPIMNQRQIDYKMKYDDILGKVKDPISDTMHVADDHTFGLSKRGCDITVGQLLHDRLPRKLSGLHKNERGIHKHGKSNNSKYVHSSERFKLMMPVIHHSLKNAHYTHGPEIISLMRQLADKSNLISMIDARRIYDHFQVPLDEELTEQLFDLVAVPASKEMINHIKESVRQNKENDIISEKHYYIENNLINWAVDWCKLSELLNWNNDKCMQNYSDKLMNITTTTATITTTATTTTTGNNLNVVKPDCYEDIENVRRRLQRAIEANVRYWTTTSSINAGNLNGLINTDNQKALVKKHNQLDKLVAMCHISTEHGNYTDESGVGSIINPNIFTDYGLTSRDLLILRNKQEILDLFTQANLCSLFKAPLSFDVVWGMARSLDERLLDKRAPITSDQVTLQSFRDALFKLLNNFRQKEFGSQ